ncbi:sulfate adenylyltransferase subunit 1 [Salsipaludibacter albus]|uniref:sulfate adenylyltransferase subunit 1 n=1 Tax=Salsipaludibacter albus TaxID=2849650 RepID=UPI001EE4B5A1|nr:GTP-binding protein [Salsipaludibacter albus]
MTADTTDSMELVRLATTGSVDDGKSTLIGRLLLDTKQIFADQLEAIEEASRQRGTDYVDLALLTDGLRAEREQGITIDVAYRYFATPKRSFILADTPGHIQYTRNMVTGASTADVALILIDVRNGVIEQTRRHSFIASLLEVPHLVVCVNKMDLVDYDQAAYDAVVDDFRDFAARLNIHDLRFVPVSALRGDNVVDQSDHMPWYQGPPVLRLLEEIHIASDRNLIDVRFPVQYVIRPHRMDHQDYRGYAGQVASGVLKVGDEVVVLPSGYESRIAAIDTYDGPISEAAPPMSVTIRLEDDLDVSRGDMLARPNNMPHNGQDLDVMVCWMSDERGLHERDKLAIKHTTNWGRVMVKDFHYRLDINTLHRDEDATGLALNEIGRMRLRATRPILFDEYRRNRATGSFILVDESTNDTVGAGMVLGPAT